MAKRRKVGNLLALGLLGLLAAGEAMHPYEMAQLLRRTGKDHDIKIKWGSLYTVVQNLDKHGFIAPTRSDRAGRRPERTVYAITEAGRAELRDWLRELMSVPEPEYPRFQAALSVAGVLPPDEVAELLRHRIAALEATLAEQRAMLAGLGDLARVFVIEAEYAVAMVSAELAWVRGLHTEIVDGTLSGVDGWRAYHESGTPPAGWGELLKEVRAEPESH